MRRDARGEKNGRCKMRLCEQVPLNNYLPIPTLFKLGDPFLILKLCTMNKKAFFYIEKYPEKLEAVILSSILGANFEEGLKLYVFEKYYFVVSYERTNSRLDFLRHLLDYHIFLEKQKRADWVFDIYVDKFSYDANKFFQEFFHFFFGTRERVIYFFDSVNKTQLCDYLYCDAVREDVYTLIYGDDGHIIYESLNAGVMSYAYSIKFGYQEVKNALESLLEDSKLELGRLLEFVEFDFEMLLLEL